MSEIDYRREYPFVFAAHPNQGVYFSCWAMLPNDRMHLFMWHESLTTLARQKLYEGFK